MGWPVTVRWRWMACLGAVLCLGAARSAVADVAPAEPEPDGLHAKDSNQGVFVRDSAVAIEKMALAQRMQRLKEWNKAADVFQEILEKYPDRVVQSRVDEQGRIDQYTSVTLSVRQQLAQWPEEGLRVYKARYEPTAAAMLRQARAGDLGVLNRVYALYFVTDAARQAGLMLVDQYFESGEFTAAAWIGDEMLRWHPSLGEARPALLFRVAIAFHFAGEKDQANQRLQVLREKFPKAEAVVAGKTANLVETLAALLNAPPPAHRIADAGDWSTFMGNAQRSLVPAVKGRMGARLYSVELNPGRWTLGGNEQIRQFMLQSENDRKSGAMLGVFPAVRDGEMYFQDGGRVYAVNLESGVPLAGWARTYGGDRNGQYVSGGWGMPREQLLTVTVTDRDVLAVLNQPDRIAAAVGQINAGERDPRLVCLDRTSGAVRWSLSNRQLPESAETPRELSFSGTPLVVGENVYVAATGGKGAQFQDAYVLCFSLVDGRFQWACYLASAATGNMMWAGDIATSSRRLPQLSFADGRLYALTNLGALAAVDPYRGSILWLSIYPRDSTVDGADMRFRRFTQNTDTTVKPWTCNPVIASDGKLFILPGDARHVLVYDAASGVEVKRINRVDAAGADTLVGVVGDRLIVASQRTLMCLNWPAYDARTFTRTNSEMIYWPKPLNGELCGRPFMTRDSVFVSTSSSAAPWQLQRIDLVTGKVKEIYPPEDAQPGDLEEPGNVLVSGSYVVVAGSSRVNVYADMAWATARLDAEVAAAPEDPAPRLRYAEMMFAAGRTDVALQKLDEAVALMGGASSLRAGPQRDRLFTDALTFARKLAQSKDARIETMQLANAMFDRAAISATTASQKVDYFTSRAQFSHSLRDFAEEVSLNQQILLDPALREVMQADAEGMTPAGLVAERQIDALVRNFGSSLYAPFEKAAVEARAKAEGDPASLLEIARRYPNADVAPQVMLQAAEAFEAAGDPRQATVVLRAIYFKYPAAADRARVVEAMVRNYLRLPNHMEIALARLQQGAKLPMGGKLTRALTLPDGKVLAEGTSFADAATALREVTSRRQAAHRTLPDLGLPSPRTREGRAFESEKGVIVANIGLLVPIASKHARWDRLVTWSAPRMLAVYPVGGSAPAMTASAVTEPPLWAAWLGDELLVLTPRQLMLLQPDGKPAWQVALDELPKVELAGLGDSRAISVEQRGGNANPRLVLNHRRMVLPQNRMRGNVAGGAVVVERVNGGGPPAVGGGEQWMDVTITTDRIVACTSTGRVLAVDRRAGTVAWQTRLLEDRPVERLLSNEDFTVGQISDGTMVYLVVLDTLSGEVVHRWKFAANTGSTPLNLALSPDGMLVYTLPDRIRGKDLYEPDVAGPNPFTWEARGKNAAEPLFAGMNGTGELLIDEGRVIALSDRGQYVRVYALQGGQPLGDATADVPAGPALPLSTGVVPSSDPTQPTAVQLQVVDQMLYIMGPRSVQAYNLAHPQQSWRSAPDQLSLQRMFVGKNHLVVIDDPLGAEQGPHASYRLLAFSRRSTPSGESGRLDYMPVLHDPQGIDDIQPVEGGLYYHCSDGRLHFLRGAQPAGQ